MIELGLELASERDPQRLLASFCSHVLHEFFHLRQNVVVTFISLCIYSLADNYI